MYFSESVVLLRTIEKFADEMSPFAPGFVPSYGSGQLSEDRLNWQIRVTAGELSRGRRGAKLGTSEFLAKRLVTVERNHDMATLATPLFVALHDWPTLSQAASSQSWGKRQYLLSLIPGPAAKHGLDSPLRQPQRRTRSSG